MLRFYISILRLLLPVHVHPYFLDYITVDPTASARRPDWDTY